MQYRKNSRNLDIWHKTFPDCAPLTWTFREKKRENWFRIYSLPLGKRYASNAKEDDEIVRRNNFVFDALFSEKKIEFLTIFPLEKLADEFSEFSRYKAKLFLDIGIRDSIKYYDKVNDEEYDLFYIFSDNKLQNFDEIIKLVSKDFVMQPIFWNLEDVIYSPYDGGADIFLFDIEKLKKFKMKFGGWLSDQASGL